MSLSKALQKARPIRVWKPRECQREIPPTEAPPCEAVWNLQTQDVEEKIILCGKRSLRIAFLGVKGFYLFFCLTYLEGPVFSEGTGVNGPSILVISDQRPSPRSHGCTLVKCWTSQSLQDTWDTSCLCNSFGRQHPIILSTCSCCWWWFASLWETCRAELLHCKRIGK